MCGIAGILHLDGSLCDRSDVQRITDVLAHRGPDGSGIYTDGRVGLGHRRLAILDLSKSGKQPMSVLDGRALPDHVQWRGFQLPGIAPGIAKAWSNISLRDRHRGNR